MWLVSRGCLLILLFHFMCLAHFGNLLLPIKDCMMLTLILIESLFCCFYTKCGWNIKLRASHTLRISASSVFTLHLTLQYCHFAFFKLHGAQAMQNSEFAHFSNTLACKQQSLALADFSLPVACTLQTLSFIILILHMVSKYKVLLFAVFTLQIVCTI